MTEPDIEFGVAPDTAINASGAHRATLFSRFDPSVSVPDGRYPGPITGRIMDE